MKKVVFQTKSTSETIRIGKSIGSLLLPGDVVALVGELGTGKTQFIKGLAEGVGLGRPTYISSPSFTLINEYVGKVPFYHIDLFRLKSEKEAEILGLEEYFQGEGITAIEWADKIPSLLPKGTLWIHIRYTGKHTRSFEIIGKGKRYQAIVNPDPALKRGALEAHRIYSIHPRDKSRGFLRGGVNKVRSDEFVVRSCQRC